MKYNNLCSHFIRDKTLNPYRVLDFAQSWTVTKWRCQNCVPGPGTLRLTHVFQSQTHCPMSSSFPSLSFPHLTNGTCPKELAGSVTETTAASAALLTWKFPTWLHLHLSTNLIKSGTTEATVNAQDRQAGGQLLGRTAHLSFPCLKFCICNKSELKCRWTKVFSYLKT